MGRGGVPITVLLGTDIVYTLIPMAAAKSSAIHLRVFSIHLLVGYELCGTALHS